MTWLGRERLLPVIAALLCPVAACLSFESSSVKASVAALTAPARVPIDSHLGLQGVRGRLLAAAGGLLVPVPGEDAATVRFAFRNRMHHELVVRVEGGGQAVQLALAQPGAPSSDRAFSDLQLASEYRQVVETARRVLLLPAEAPPPSDAGVPPVTTSAPDASAPKARAKQGPGR